MQAVLGQGTQWLQSSESGGLQVCEEQLVVTVWDIRLVASEPF